MDLVPGVSWRWLQDTIEDVASSSCKVAAARNVLISLQNVCS